jgi:hypothetical protein
VSECLLVWTHGNKSIVHVCNCHQPTL